MKKKLKGILDGYRKFAFKGNVLDLATGVIIGGAFGKIVSSVTVDIIMPLFSMITGTSNIKEWFVPILRNGQTAPETIAKAVEAGIATVNYGLFISNIIDFLIISTCIFVMISIITKAKDKFDKPAPAPKTAKNCTYCCSVIDLKAVKCPHCCSDL